MVKREPNEVKHQEDSGDVHQQQIRRPSGNAKPNSTRTNRVIQISRHLCQQQANLG